jgi:predicted ferric reductase
MSRVQAAAVAPRKSARRDRPPAPRVWPIQGADVAVVVGFNAALVVGMWVRHGGLNGLGSASALLTALGQVTALVGTYAALVQIVLMTRTPWLEQILGLDGLAKWHHWLGFACTTLICGHVVLTTAGYALGDGSSLTSEFWTLMTTYPYMLAATVGTVLLVMVAITSVRIARERVRHETWHFVHLYAYLAIALAFGHELAVGSDLATDPVARGYWCFLYAVVVGLILVFRVGQPLINARRHRLRVTSTVHEAPGVVSIHIGGRDLGRLAVAPGQFFRWRFLTREGWWHAHHFSLSAPPDGRHLRITVKGVGDHTRALAGVRAGTKVVAEGPYGLFTGQRRRYKKALLVGGGIGITPLRALLDDMPRGKDAVVLIYRAGSEADLVFRDELESTLRERGGRMHVILGHRADLPTDPLSPAMLRRLCPDAAQRDVYICGPSGMTEHVAEGLRATGVSPDQIHRERFAVL